MVISAIQKPAYPKKNQKNEDPHRFEGKIGVDEGVVQLRNWTRPTAAVRVVQGREPIARPPGPPGWRMAGVNATPRRNDRGARKG